MRRIIQFLILALPIATIGQTNTLENIDWKGAKRMDKKFMNEFIQSKINSNLDSLKLENDVDALTRLNGISKVTYEVKNSNPESSSCFCLESPRNVFQRFDMIVQNKYKSRQIS